MDNLNFCRPANNSRATTRTRANINILMLGGVSRATGWLFSPFGAGKRKRQRVHCFRPRLCSRLCYSLPFCFFATAAGGCGSYFAAPNDASNCLPPRKFRRPHWRTKSGSHDPNHVFFVIAGVLREPIDVGLPGCRAQRVPVSGV